MPAPVDLEHLRLFRALCDRVHVGETFTVQELGPPPDATSWLGAILEAVGKGMLMTLGRERAQPRPGDPPSRERRLTVTRWKRLK